jgi:hypothetical protein
MKRRLTVVPALLAGRTTLEVLSGRASEPGSMDSKSGGFEHEHDDKTYFLPYAAH